MTNATKTVFKIIGLIILLVFLFFVAMLVFLGIFGTGGQASGELDGGIGGLLVYTLPVIIVGIVAYKIFGRIK